MFEVKELWNNISQSLSKRIDTESYERYIQSIVPVSFEEDQNTIVLGVANEFLALWLKSNYAESIETCILNTLEIPLKVRLVGGYAPPKVAKPKPKVAIPVKQSSVAPLKRAKVDLGRTTVMRLTLRPDYNFNSLVVGHNNRVCVAAATAVANSPGTEYNPLFIYGCSGLGKTHVLQAIANQVLAETPESKIEYLTSEEFVNLYIEAVKNSSLPEFRKRFRNLDMLLIDDVQFFKGKVGSSEEFFHTFNSLHNSHKQIILAADRTPHEIDLDDRLISRFDWGLSIEVLPPDYETRLAILRKKQEKQAVTLSDDILKLIAARIQSNMRTLESALTILAMNVSALGCDMTLDLAEQLLKDKFEIDEPKAITIEQIQKDVAAHFGLKVSDILGKKRPQNISQARMVAMYLSRKLTKQSYPVIGEAFNRNHATILHAEKTILEKIAEDDNLQTSVHSLEKKFKL
ncbi:MAG: chromosomal replication initiator protein DnaA [Lentisphaeria bacterium]|nr:chromosomal replication initiator protein DnaA [Lentisphaeria bacterium]